jgi:hypothetical protein
MPDAIPWANVGNWNLLGGIRLFDTLTVRDFIARVSEAVFDPAVDPKSPENRKRGERAESKSNGGG